MTDLIIDSLNNFISKRALNNIIILTFSNKGYVDMTMNWLKSVQLLNIKNYAIVSLDPETEELLSEKGVYFF